MCVCVCVYVCVTLNDIVKHNFSHGNTRKAIPDLRTHTWKAIFKYLKIYKQMPEDLYTYTLKDLWPDTWRNIYRNLRN